MATRKKAAQKRAVRARAKRGTIVRNNPIAKPGRKPQQTPAAQPEPNVAAIAEIDGIMKYLRGSIRNLGVELQERITTLAEETVQQTAASTASVAAGKRLKLTEQFGMLQASVDKLHGAIGDLMGELAPMIENMPEAGFTAREPGKDCAPLMYHAITLQNQIDGAIYRINELRGRLV